MGQCKKDITPLLMHWSYVFLALTHRYSILLSNPPCDKLLIFLSECGTTTNIPVAPFTNMV